MSVTLPVLAFGVRQHMNDLDPDDYVVSSPRIWRALVDCARVWGPRAGFVETYSTSLIVLSNSESSDFAFAATDCYSNVRDLILHSNGTRLRRASREEIESLMDGGTASGTPEVYYLHEAAAQQRKARFWPRPNASDTVDGWTSAFPTSGFTSASTLDFSPLMLQGIVADVASKFIAGLNDEQRAKLKPTRDAEDLAADGLAALNEEVKRMQRMKRIDRISVVWAG